jgi:dTDP-glucose 4,6-dehydratase
MTHILITGGCGFIGHYLVDAVLKTTDWSVSIFDALTYASRGLDRLKDIKALESQRVRVFPLDISQPISMNVKKELGTIDYIVHLAAEVHVDKSIEDPERFVRSNVLGTFQMLQFARECCPKYFIYASTDEVFGPAFDGISHREWTGYNSSNPYSATKASGEELSMAWANTYKVPVVVTHTTNVFGIRQNPEAFIPDTIAKILQEEKVFINADDTKTRSGARFYICGADVAYAILFLIMNNATTRDKFNITGEQEVSNLELAQRIAVVLGKNLNHCMTNTVRPGCDFRYALDGSKMSAMGWRPVYGLRESLEKIVRWYSENPSWLERHLVTVFGRP